MKNLIAVFIAGVLLTILPEPGRAQSAVTVSEVREVIPTYLAGPPDPNPMFYFGRNSQGAEGKIYPYPFYDNLTNTMSDKEYNVVYMENEYVKISILPEVGGRLFSALDKTNNYKYIYSQSVIKPALIGLIGAWISGGIEWNIPHHHRASTFIPVQWKQEDNPDGSKTVWVGELEIRHRMRWAVGYTLHPGSTVLECKVRIVNRTPEVHTMLCFANVAVHTNLDYQVIFPPTTQWATGHNKTRFTPWPVDDGVDLSYYRNASRSGSFFAWNYEEDFVAGYDHGAEAGVMAFANHHIVPGKKFFTWGVGSMWDGVLTDDDGPYLEIMVGAYSDNQPDYSWLQPFEERAFEMYWYPFRGTGGAKNANLDASVNLEVSDGMADLAFYTTRAHSKATVVLTAGDRILLKEETGIDPGRPYKNRVSLPSGVDEHDLRASLSSEGNELIAYSPVRLEPVPMPEPVTTPPAPEEMDNNEELFMAGQWIDQFHNPSRDPDPYWEELLRRDPGSIPGNTSMGLLALRDARYGEAEQYFRKALERLTYRHIASRDVEPYYYLGVALKAQGRLDEAYDAFYEATWRQQWKSPAYFALAEITTMRGEFQAALDLVDQSLDANALNVRAYGLKASLLRHLDRNGEALEWVEFAMEKTDPLDVRLMAERWLADREGPSSRLFYNVLNEHTNPLLETAAEYLNAGLWGDGTEVLAQTIASARDRSKISPLVYYYLGEFAERMGDQESAALHRKQAVVQSPEYVFPFQDELIPVLEHAIRANQEDARAHYYLGNLLFDWQPDRAISHWEQSVSTDPEFPIAWRNLAVAYSERGGDEMLDKAIACYENAVNLDNPYPTHFAELDRLYSRAGTPVNKRLAILETNQETVARHDEALGDMINLMNLAGETDESIRLMQGHIFSIAEGGSAFNSGLAWAEAHLIRGIQRFGQKDYNRALEDFTSALTPPENLRAEQRFDTRNTVITYWTGCACEALGRKDEARRYWEEIIAEGQSPAAAGGFAGRRRRNPLAEEEQMYYQALAKQKLGQTDGVRDVFSQLVSSGTEVLEQDGNQGNAPFPGQGSSDNVAMAHYIMGLGHAGLGDMSSARREFSAALESSPDFLSAKLALDQL